MKINTLIAKIAVSSGLLVSTLFVGSMAHTSVASAASCGGVDTAILSCPSDFDGSGTGATAVQKSGLMGVLTVVVNIMAAAVGILAIGTFVYAGIIYASAGDSQENVKKALGIIRNTVIGLVLFVALYALVNYIVPGGVL